MRILLYITLSVIVLSCAQIRTPTGGVKDVVGPAIAYSYPSHLETNYSAKSIAITFDELVSLKNAKNNVIISPPLVSAPEIYLKGGKTLIISFTDTLESNTTYTLNMAEAIVDYNEGNAIIDKSIVFSTGDDIDSLTYNGQVFHSETSLPCTNCKVMLYQDQNDSIVYNEKPYYFTTTNDRGQYDFNFLKSGDFKIIALSDYDSDFMYDEYDDEIGFMENPIQPVSDSIFVEGNELYVFKKAPDEVLLDSYKMEGDQKLNLIFNKPTDSISIVKDSVLLGENDIQTIWNEKLDSAQIWFSTPGEKNDNWKLSVNRNDQEIEKITLFIKGDENELELSSPRPGSSKKVNVKDTLKLSWSNPIEAINDSLIKVVHGTDSIDFSMKKINAISYALLFPKQEAEKYVIQLDSGAVVDLYGASNDVISFNITGEEATYFGKLSIKIPALETNQILFLQNKSGDNIRSAEVSDTSAVVFTDIHPGAYDIVILADDNGNGKWDPGDYLKKKQPEKVKRHRDPVEVRSNWEVEVVVE